ncbi:unnamed protein product, partial [Prorocentrum cordatum]
ARYQSVFGARSGERLDHTLAKRCRGEERRQLEGFQVFDRVPKNSAKGKRARGKWVDDERCDEDVTESVRSRSVAMHFAWDVRDDTFAGTPSLAAFRLVVSSASSLYSTGVGYDGMIALYDVSVAFFRAYIDKDVHVVMEKGGFTRTKVTAQVYYYQERLLMVIVHGDDFLAGGKTESLDWLDEWDHWDGLLGAEHATAYRSMAPTALCVAHDRFDIQLAVGYLMRGMVAPTWHRGLLLQRLASYLEQHLQFELFFEFRRMPEVIVAEVDSDWASEPGRRGVWLRGVMLKMGLEMTLQVNADSSGAKGIASRLGGGKGRHLETKRFWVQERVRDKTISMAKIHADTNRADMKTESLEGPRFLKLLAMLPLRTRSGRRTVMFELTLAIAFLSAWIGHRVYKAPMRLLMCLWELVGDGGDQIVQVEAPPGDEHLAIVESGVSRHTHTTPIMHCWTWGAAELRDECLRLGIYRGQLTAQMIK